MNDLRTTPQSRSRRWFYGVFLASLVFSAVYLALRRGDGLTAFFYQNGTNALGDFTNNLRYPTHAGGPYFDSCWASFPPLAYTFYLLITVCFTRAVFSTEIIAYLLITSLTVMLMLYAVEVIFERCGKRERGRSEALAFSLCIAMSGVSIYTIERGNCAFNVTVLMLWAIALRDSDVKWQRELALVMIAVAASIKVYPCLLGLLYLQEKRWKEAVRLMIYGVVLFFVPFAWFSGADGLKQWLANQQEIHSMYRNDFLTSIPSVLSFVEAELGWAVGSTATVGKLLAYAFGAVLIACTLLAKQTWMRCLLLMSLATLVPGWSAEYMAMYMVLPCTLYHCAPPSGKAWKDAAYMALFGGIFILLPFGTGFQTHAAVSWNMLVSFACIYLITFLAIGDVLAQTVRERKAKRAGAAA